jgi:DNA-binding LytR/AlgR family response regulator
MKEDTNLGALLVDDEVEAINMLEFLVGKIDGLAVVGTTTHPEKVLSLYLKLKPDIIFMDVQMGSMSGLDVVRELHELELNPLVVFTTAYNSYAIQAIKQHAFDYLLKPVDEAELIEVVGKARDFIDKHNLEKKLDDLEKIIRNHHKLRFSTRSGFILIHPDEVMYIESAANYSEIYLSKDKREVVSMNIGAIEEILPRHFIRISRSHIINTAWLTRVSGTAKKCFLKKGDEEIAFNIPEKQLPELKKKLEK